MMRSRHPRIHQFAAALIINLNAVWVNVAQTSDFNYNTREFFVHTRTCQE
jgi:hypothetical protein